MEGLACVWKNGGVYANSANDRIWQQVSLCQALQSSFEVSLVILMQHFKCDHDTSSYTSPHSHLSFTPLLISCTLHTTNPLTPLTPSHPNILLPSHIPSSLTHHVLTPSHIPYSSPFPSHTLTLSPPQPSWWSPPPPVTHLVVDQCWWRR